jgi:hypothetical protein
VCVSANPLGRSTTVAALAVSSSPTIAAESNASL